MNGLLMGGDVPQTQTTATSPFLHNSSHGNITIYFERGIYDHILDEFHAALFLHREGRSIALICLYVPVFLLAFVGNVLVLLVVLPNRRMRSITNYFIVNMAVSDLLGKHKSRNFIICILNHISKWFYCTDDIIISVFIVL